MRSPLLQNDGSFPDIPSIITHIPNMARAPSPIFPPGQQPLLSPHFPPLGPQGFPPPGQQAYPLPSQQQPYPRPASPSIPPQGQPSFTFPTSSPPSVASIPSMNRPPSIPSLPRVPSMSSNNCGSSNCVSITNMPSLPATPMSFYTPPTRFDYVLRAGSAIGTVCSATLAVFTVSAAAVEKNIADRQYSDFQNFLTLFWPLAVCTALVTGLVNTLARDFIYYRLLERRIIMDLKNPSWYRSRFVALILLGMVWLLYFCRRLPDPTSNYVILLSNCSQLVFFYLLQVFWSEEKLVCMNKFVENNHHAAIQHLQECVFVPDSLVENIYKTWFYVQPLNFDQLAYIVYHSTRMDELPALPSPPPMVNLGAVERLMVHYVWPLRLVLSPIMNSENQDVRNTFRLIMVLGLSAVLAVELYGFIQAF
eukprot:TRINITY_DN1425_c0_g1_i1.p1 TRINITY_DN1425_c0_g1~~TRINITY_DN1425_c0_g1_i1.p1  ORF type:complete len:421 (+),score=99.80 TRINITY_DN1425_c0_g1_i1:86-1348(+)